jgi:hypothetical protein
MELQLTIVGKESARYDCPTCTYFINVERTTEFWDEGIPGLTIALKEVIDIVDRMGF